MKTRNHTFLPLAAAMGALALTAGTANAGTIYSDDFDGAASSILGLAPDVAPGGEVWVGNGTGVHANGSRVDGSSTAYLPFTPTVGNVYTLSADVNSTGGTWTYFGFISDNPAGQNLRHDSMGSYGSFLYYNENVLPNNVLTYYGENANGSLMTTAAGVGADNLKAVLDATDANSANWTMALFVNGTEVRAAATAPVGDYGNIRYAGFNPIAGGGLGTVDNFLLEENVTGGGDTTPPDIATLAPVNTASNVAVNTNLVITFDEDVQKGTAGDIVIQQIAGGTFETIPVSSANVTINGAEVTIVPSSSLANSTGYYVEIDSGAIKDLAGNSFAGITGNATWSFTTMAVNPIETGGPIINEFCADNDDLIEDEDLNSSDWLEIYNGQNSSVNLAGYYLTDDPATPAKWPFPAVTIPEYGYLLVFASGKDRSDPAGFLHTDFTLKKSGGYLALVAPDGLTVLSDHTFGAQYGDISYGELGHARTLGFFETPTPGSENGGLQSPDGPAEDVRFDRIGGLFSNSTTLTIEPLVSPTAVVRYTTDNTIPTESSTVYNGTPFTITNTTTIRARTFDPGRLPGEVKSRTLIELASDVQNFNSALPIVVADSDSVPIDDYSSPGCRPFRPVYTVVIDKNPADGFARMTTAPDFTGRGGMHVRGKSSSGFLKKQYAWETWNNEDEDKNVSILGMPSESDWILHAPYSDKTLMRNVLVYDCARALYGNAGGVRTKFVDLFFNQDGGAVSMADYRGVYVVMEKIKRDKERVDIEKLNESVTDPALITGGYIFKKNKPPYSQPWTTTTEGILLHTHDPETLNAAQFSYLTGYVNDFEAALHGAGFDDPATGYAAYIDVLSFIDNHLFVELFKEVDGFTNSQYFSKDRDEKIRALPVWDYNLALGNANFFEGQNATGWYYPQMSGAHYYWYQRLFLDKEFVLSYWDRFWELRRGKFADAALLAQIDAYDAELDAPNAVGESAVTRNFAEWNILGSYVWPNADGYGGRTTHQSEVDWMKNWLTTRLAWVETQSQGTSGTALPPTFNQYGGTAAAGFQLTMSDPNGWAGSTIYYTLDGSDPRAPGTTAMAYTGPVPLAGSVEVKARVSDGSMWSPMSQGLFLVDAVAASATNIVISEFNYRAAAPSAAEIAAGYTSRSNFDYIELLNIDPISSVNLDGVQFTDGVTFTFDDTLAPEALLLPPGGRVIIADNPDAFAFRYGGSGAIVAGNYGGGLSNEGERITFLDASLNPIKDFIYGIAEPWPVAADGAGYSLVLIDPDSNPPHGDPFSWRSSVGIGGTPGGDDSMPFLGDPDADDDNDGMTALLEYALGTSDHDSSSRSAPSIGIDAVDVGGEVDDYLVYEFQVNLAGVGVDYTIESSSNLSAWADATADFVYLSTANNGDGTATVRYRSAVTFPLGDPRLFFRLRISN